MVICTSETIVIKHILIRRREHMTLCCFYLQWYKAGLVVDQQLAWSHRHTQPDRLACLQNILCLLKTVQYGSKTHQNRICYVSICVFLHIWVLCRIMPLSSIVLDCPFHPYFSIKDTFGFIILIILLTTLTLKDPYILGEPDNFTPTNPLVTPVHIQPE